ncbi:MAG: tyrosine-type recombinase/integrase, partial [Oscillospiraceae bacterium]|nr:tyrosine-type recombinase/integrase [Oscillospiraceae bacterium]
LTQFSYHSEEGGYLQGGIKTEAGKNRIVPVHPKIVPYVKKLLATDTEYLITRNGEPMLTSYYRRKCFQPIAEALGCPEATPHWCRHTFATRLHNAGADPLTTKWLLGHSTKGDVTNRYTHATIATLVKEIRKLA